MIDKITANARCPQKDEYGRAMLERMNLRHNEMALWALEKLDFENCEKILDIGCGGGKNIENLLSMSGAEVFGIDMSRASIEKSVQINFEAIGRGRARVRYGKAKNIPFAPESFDIITAFETVYYWEDIAECFLNIKSRLKSGGSFLICNEDNSIEGNEEIAKELNMSFYSLKQLEALLREAGFTSVYPYQHENGKWICIVGKA